MIVKIALIVIAIVCLAIFTGKFFKGLDDGD
jgi:hypothetical protein